jgi:hypothetical protein
MNWFRFYGDALRDAKLRRAARLTGQTFAQVLGVWAVILCYASDSPVRGVLWLAPDVPVTDDDIAEAAGCNVSETLQLFRECAMLELTATGAYAVSKWADRQYVSDNSSERVREYRERQKSAPKAAHTPAETPETAANGPHDTPETLPQRPAVTLVQRFGNTPDTDTDTELKDDDAGARAIAGAIKAYENQIGLLSGAHQSGEMTAIIAELHARGVLVWWQTALNIACDANARNWRYVRAILENSIKTGSAPGAQKPPAAAGRSNGNGTLRRGLDPALAAAKRKQADEYDNEAALARI